MLAPPAARFGGRRLAISFPSVQIVAFAGTGTAQATPACTAREVQRGDYYLLKKPQESKIRIPILPLEGRISFYFLRGS